MSIELWHVSTAQPSVCLVQHLEVADNPWLRFKGLMGRPTYSKGLALWIEPCNSIHSFFMRFEFDAVFLSKTGEVLHVLQAMKPWRFSPVIWKAAVVVEFPSGGAAAIQLGDRLERRTS